MHLCCTLVILLTFLVGSALCCFGRGAGKALKMATFKVPKVKTVTPHFVYNQKHKLPSDMGYYISDSTFDHWRASRRLPEKYQHLYPTLKTKQNNVWTPPRTNIGPRRRVDRKGRVVCYFRDWTINRPGVGRYGIEDVPGELCTHVVYSFVGLNSDTFELTGLEQQEAFPRFTALKTKFPELKTLLALGGSTENGHKYSQMVANEAKRRNAISSIINFMKQYRFDGIDIHWEYPGESDRNGSTADKVNFINELRRAFDKEDKGWEITMAIPLREEVVRKGYHLSGLCQSVDAVHVMPYYNMESSWDQMKSNSFLNKPKHNTTAPDDIFVLNDRLRTFEELGCPANKIVLGVPFYGLISTPNNNATDCDLCMPSDVSDEEGTLSNSTVMMTILEYNKLCQEIKNDSGWTEKWNEEGSVPYAYKGNQWIGYENPRSVQIKMNIIRYKGYAGAVAWALDMDDFRGVCGSKYPLLNILHDNLKDYTLPAHTRNINIGRLLTPPTTTEAPRDTSTCHRRYLRHEVCNKYYECNKGATVERTCPKNTIFDLELQGCGSPQNSGLPHCRQMFSSVRGISPLPTTVYLTLYIVWAAC